MALKDEHTPRARRVGGLGEIRGRTRGFLGGASPQSSAHDRPRSTRRVRTIGHADLCPGDRHLRVTHRTRHVVMHADRVRIADGLPQVYGTQAHIGNGRLEFYPIEDAASVDQRRASLGMVPLSEYRRALEQAYLIRSPGNS